jgi:hypothetical protein
LIFGMCLGVNAIALVLNVNFRKLGWLEWRWFGSIYSLQPFPSRWLFLLSMGAPDSLVVHRTARWCTEQATVHCPVHATSAACWGLERLTVGVLCLVAALDSLLPHRTCSVCSDFAA